MSKKIALNSAFMAIGNQYFRYYKLANAEMASLYLDRYQSDGLRTKMNKKMNTILKTEDKDYVIASDTDSIYLHMGPLVDRVYEK